jgi:hypothetical protein
VTGNSDFANSEFAIILTTVFFLCAHYDLGDQQDPVK